MCVHRYTAHWSIPSDAGEVHDNLLSCRGGPELLQSFGFQLDPVFHTYTLHGDACTDWRALPAPVLASLQARLAELDAHAVPELDTPEAADVGAISAALGFLALRVAVPRRTFAAATLAMGLSSEADAAAGADAGEDVDGDGVVDRTPEEERAARARGASKLARIAALDSQYSNTGSHLVGVEHSEPAGARWLLATTTLVKYLDNALRASGGAGAGLESANPERFRRINRDNPNFQQRLGRLNGGSALLVAVGFREEPGGTAMVLESGSDLRWLRARLLELRAALPMLREIVAAQAADDKATAEKAGDTAAGIKGRRGVRGKAPGITARDVSPVRVGAASPKRLRRGRRAGGGAEEKKAAPAAPAAATGTDKTEAKAELMDALGYVWLCVWLRVWLCVSHAAAGVHLQAGPHVGVAGGTGCGRCITTCPGDAATGGGGAAAVTAALPAAITRHRHHPTHARRRPEAPRSSRRPAGSGCLGTGCRGGGGWGGGCRW